MTPAVNFAKKNHIPVTIHKYTHDPNHGSYGLEAAEKLEVVPDRVFKTLVAQLDSGELVVAVLPVTISLDLKALAKYCLVKKAGLAQPATVEKTTGYQLGGVSPLGQKRVLRTLVDASSRNFTSIFVSGGRRGVEIEIGTDDLIKATQAQLVVLGHAS